MGRQKPQDREKKKLFPQQSYAILEGTGLRDQIFPLGFCVSFEKGDAFAVTDLAITLLCAAGLFLALLEGPFPAVGHCGLLWGRPILSL